jgi:hypothetical protein
MTSAAVTLARRAVISAVTTTFWTLINNPQPAGPALNHDFNQATQLMRQK